MITVSDFCEGWILKTAIKGNLSASVWLGCLLAGLLSSLSAGLYPPEVSAKEKPEETTAEVQVSNDKTHFADEENGYSLEFPPGWKTEKDRIVNIVAAPVESFKNPNPIPNIKVVVRTIPEGMNLDTICDGSIRQWSAIWKVESDQHSTEGKTPTRRLIIVQSIPLALGTSERVVQETKVLKAFAVHKDKYFIISCAAFVDNFEKYQKEFTEVIDSLTMTN